MNKSIEQIRADFERNKPDATLNTAWADCMNDLGIVLAELTRRDDAIKWVLNDAAYKPPESIAADITERWIARLREAQEPPSDLQRMIELVR